jgi:hypothetical protein
VLSRRDERRMSGYRLQSLHAFMLDALPALEVSNSFKAKSKFN